MRFLTLGLDRYGPFDGRSLHFRPDARLHVVFGPNEAGKSSALAAVTDLLFGIPNDTAQDFRHPRADLTLSASITSAAGPLTLRRISKRSLKGSLIGADDRPLPDDALRPHLGEVSRQDFRQAFGLDAEALRKGAAELIAAGGEAGSALFAAAAGLSGVADLRARLVADADLAFAGRKSANRRFYMALDAFEQARSRLKETELSETALRKLNAEIAEAAATLATAKPRRSEIRRRRDDLDRALQVRPLIEDIDRLDAGSTAGGGPARLDAATVEALGRAIAELEAATEAQTKAGREHDEAKDAWDAITVAEPVLDRAVAITDAVEDIGEARSAATDLPRIAQEERDYEARLTLLAAELGFGTRQDLLDARPTAADQADGRALADEVDRLALKRAGLVDDIQAETANRDTLKAEATAALTDPAPLKARRKAMGDVDAAADRRRRLATEIATAEARLSEAAARLDPPVHDLDRLAALPLPALDAIEAAADAADRLAADRAAGEALARDAERLAADAESSVESLSRTGPVATPARIAEVRLARDTEWQALQGALFGASGALAGAALAATVARFEVLKAEADRLADAATTDQKRIAEVEAATRRAAGERARAAAAREALAELAAAAAAAEAAFRAAFAPARLIPRAPAAMRSWRVALDKLFERRDSLIALRTEAAGIDAGFAARLPAFRAFAAELDLATAGLNELPQLATAIDNRLEDIARQWEQARTTQTRLSETERRLAAATTALETCTADLAERAARLDKAARRIGLPPGATPAGVRAAIERWQKVEPLEEARRNRAERVQGMKRDIEAFDDKVATLAADLADHLAPGIGFERSEVIARHLADRLDEARRAADRRKTLGAQLKKRVEELGTATAARDRAARTLAAALAATGPGTPPAEAAALHERLRRRLALEAAAAEKRRALALIGQGASEQDLRASAATIDPAAAEAERQSLAHEDEALDAREKAAYATHERLTAERARLPSLTEAEVAIQARHVAEAGMAEAAREWLVLRLAERLLRGVEERQREQRRSPLIDRAGDLFRRLTGGGFAAFAIDEDDKGRALLTARRATGETVAIDGLSEGTRDQFYLALRLAAVEAHARSGTVPPFLADDLFASFDDTRTGYGLEALAAIGAGVQPILFTHHRAVIDTARTVLGGAVDIIELG